MLGEAFSLNTIKYYTLIFVGVFFFVIICATAFFSHRAYVASVRIEEHYRQSLGDLEQEVILKSEKKQLMNQNKKLKKAWLVQIWFL